MDCRNSSRASSTREFKKPGAPSAMHPADRRFGDAFGKARANAQLKIDPAGAHGLAQTRREEFNTDLLDFTGS